MKKNNPYESPYIDPAQFDDPVALTTEWNSMFGMSASYTTHILVEKDTDAFLYKPTLQHIAFCFVFTLIPGFALFMTIFFGHTMFGAIICGLFLGVGILLIRESLYPMILDKKKGIFFKGWKPKKQNNKKKFARLEDIHAIQLLENRTGAELNLVLKDGSRVYVITQRSKRQMSIDGDLISRFLGVPVWDTAFEQMREQ
ncbi:MAG: hypothetical protein AAGU14_10240 [Eubacteriaceae bacterium]